MTVPVKLIARNKRASYDYFLEDSFEAGLVLQGTEAKSLRAGNCTMTEAFAIIDAKGEAWVHQLRIAPYEFGNYANHTETRKRKLLLNRVEISKIQKALATKGLSLVPTKLYFKGSLVKIEISLVKGKQQHDKRQATADKDVARKLQQRSFDE